jgi:outer membrane lipoprotein-sorting protein
MDSKRIKGVVLTLLGGMALAGTALAEPSAVEIMQRNLSTTKVLDSSSGAEFVLINAAGQQRIRDTDGQTKLMPGTTDNRRLVTFLSPADVRGTKTLLIEHSAADDDMWIYLPAMKKVRRLVASNKKDSFVGTDFSYGDVVGHKVEEWSHTLLRQEQADGKDCYVIESTPKRPEVADNTGYSKRISWIDEVRFVAIRGESYDQNGELLKRTSSKDIERVDAKNDKYQPMELMSENVQTGHKTFIKFKNFKANVGVGDEVFAARSLEN